jgi:T4 bacteriophage base plate protein
MSQNANPLKQFFRQPAIYLRLPSEGNHWPKNSLEMPENKELPVFPMTAIDEITYRTPDALYNGQAVVNVIQSCLPNIRNAWDVPAMDLNAILVAIRIASYGHSMDLTTKCPSCETEGEYSIDLRSVLDKLSSADFDQGIEHRDLVIHFRPMDYRQQNETNHLQFEQQKNIQMIQMSELTDEQKIVELNKSLQRITELTIEALKWSIASIRTPQALVTEPGFIHEFLTNCDRKLYSQIKDHIINLREASELKPLQIKCNECGHEYLQQISLDQATFFVDAS